MLLLLPESPCTQACLTMRGQARLFTSYELLPKSLVSSLPRSRKSLGRRRVAAPLAEGTLIRAQVRRICNECKGKKPILFAERQLNCGLRQAGLKLALDIIYQSWPATQVVRLCDVVVTCKLAGLQVCLGHSLTLTSSTSPKVIAQEHHLLLLLFLTINISISQR